MNVNEYNKYMENNDIVNSSMTSISQPPSKASSCTSRYIHFPIIQLTLTTILYIAGIITTKRAQTFSNHNGTA